MTELETLVSAQIQASPAATVSPIADRMAESMGEEILRDPPVRAEFVTLARDAFRQAWVDLQTRQKTERGHS